MVAGGRLARQARGHWFESSNAHHHLPRHGNCQKSKRRPEMQEPRIVNEKLTRNVANHEKRIEELERAVAKLNGVSDAQYVVAQAARKRTG